MKRIVAGFRAKLLAGIVVTVPVVATILALRFLFRTLETPLRPWIADLTGHDMPGLGLLATLMIVLLAGVLATNFVGRKLIATLERVFTEVPLVRRIYAASKDIVASAMIGRSQAFRDVVMVEFPRKGLYSYGFVTSYTTKRDGDDSWALANVFLPGPPLPTSGSLVAVPVDELYYVDMPIEAAIKLVLSAGMTAPEALDRRLPQSGDPALESPS